ncbi:D-galactarate dehydratase [Thalassobacillus devorans]|uniref:D-galactarate dehydratase n=1 Tax=Thalassobacillus devorans TaxID=279813 RepID=A0ABQ1NSG7_9BACI|nr:UxaA family hydrolase [Thalassobacillus devorans]NIK28754.1 altronate dehydratase small subunit [Thalassobacillus devorans]GGC83806.1 D-galactarate dehydratase [Thalassobacillus devorans]
MGDYKTLYLNEKDNVAVALSEIPAKTSVTVRIKDKEIFVQILDTIHFGHKFAVRPIPKNDDIVKYGEVIGAAVKDIEAGAHVHVHNLEGKRGRGDKIVQ